MKEDQKDQLRRMFVLKIPLSMRNFKTFSFQCTKSCNGPVAKDKYSNVWNDGLIGEWEGKSFDSQPGEKHGPW